MAAAEAAFVLEVIKIGLQFTLFDANAVGASFGQVILVHSSGRGANISQVKTGVTAQVEFAEVATSVNRSCEKEESKGNCSAKKFEFVRKLILRRVC